MNIHTADTILRSLDERPVLWIIICLLLAVVMSVIVGVAIAGDMARRAGGWGWGKVAKMRGKTRKWMGEK